MHPETPPLRTRDDAFFVDTNVTVEGSVTAIEWTVPRGALIEFLPAMNGAETSDFYTVMIEAAFIVPEGKRSLIQNAAVIVYRVEEDRTVAELTSVLRPTVNVQTYAPEAGPVEQRAPDLDAFRFRIGPNTIAEGQNATFVLLLQAAEEFPVRFAFKVLYSMPDQYRLGIDEFRKDFPKDATMLLPKGVGAGFTIAFFELSIGEDILGAVGPPAQSGTVQWTDGVTIVDDFPAEAPLFAVSRLLTLAVDAASDGGTSHGDGLYAATSTAGKWRLGVDCYGTIYDAESVVLEGGYHMLIVQDQTFGTPWFEVDATGHGPCRVEFALDLLGVNGRERLYFRQLQYDSSTENLFGYSLSQHAWAHLGRIGGLPGPGPLY